MPCGIRPDTATVGIDDREDAMRHFVPLQYFAISSLGLVLSGSMYAASLVCREDKGKPAATLQEARICRDEIADVAGKPPLPGAARSPERAKADAVPPKGDGAGPALPPEQIAPALPSGLRVNQSVTVLAGPRSTGAMGDALV